MAFAHSHFDLICKRVLDVGLAAIGLILAGPMMGLISLAVWLDSPGPVIFSQERLGQRGKRFKMYKFRKFPPTWGEEGPAVTAKNDVRMTRTGAVLEKTKLDELPQLWNILKGEMSVVGPRPELPCFADLFKGKYAEVLQYPQGIFGPNQVKFRNECENYPPDEDLETFYRKVLFPIKAETDLDYFRKANCLTDLVAVINGIWSSIAGLVNWRMLMHKDGRLIVWDLLLAAMSWFLANVLRFSGIPENLSFEIMIRGFLIIPTLVVLAMAIGGCYKRPPQYFSLDDALQLSLTILVSSFFILLFLIHLTRNISLYLFLILLFILLIFMAIPRVVYRFRWERSGEMKHGPNRIVIYGAGRIGIAMANMIGNGSMVGFLDDNPIIKGKLLGGRRVLGYESDIDTIFRADPFEEIWLTFAPTGQKLERMQRICRERSIKLYILPEIEPFATLLNATQ
jgi:lipopolysaccharide/colanic/teichoic acid biosynthesis glycosyltransferase